MQDRAAVDAAISTAWSNAQAEGQITKLKLVKRQMYGRGKLDLLDARVIVREPDLQQNCVRALFARRSTSAA
jgi:transposase